jgi:predicted aminopeptidase
LSASRPVQDVLNDPETSTRLHARLEVVEQARQQAQDLGLDVKGQYTSFVPWPGDRVITTVVATRPRELEPAGFSFLLVGRLPYKGFFEQKDAETEAAMLRADGFDTCVSPVTAYSTLGWLDDPVTEPMLRTTHGRIAETIVHELVHGTIFIPDDATFNESLATFVGQEASVRFFSDPASAAEQRAKVQDARLLAQQTAEFSAQVKALYESQTLDVSGDRAVLESHFREHVAGLPFRARTPQQALDLAGKIRLNDACLALRGTYGSDIPAFQKQLSDLEGDLAGFIRKMRKAAQSPQPRDALSTPRTPSQN